MSQSIANYIVLFRGDDTDFNGGSGFSFIIDTPTDSMTGFSVKFLFLGIEKNVTSFTRISEKKFSFSIQFSREETRNLPLCFQNAIIVLREEVTEGTVTRYRTRTLTNKCLIHVTNDVAEVYNSVNQPYHIQIQPGSIHGSLIGVVLDLNASLEDRMNALAQIVIRGDGTVVPKTQDDDEDDGQ